MASSLMEGSFSSFQEYLGDDPKSFVRVVQAHVWMDLQNEREEKRMVLRNDILACDVNFMSQCINAAKEYAKTFSLTISEEFEVINQQAKNYTFNKLGLMDGQKERQVTAAHKVWRHIFAGGHQVPRVVEEIDGLKLCPTYMEDVNLGYLCRHIQCVLSGAFVEWQFHDHWRIVHEVHVADIVDDVCKLVTGSNSLDVVEDGAGVKIDARSNIDGKEGCADKGKYGHTDKGKDGWSRDGYVAVARPSPD